MRGVIIFFLTYSRRLLTLLLPANCITDAVSSEDQSPKKAEQTKLTVWGTSYGVTIRENLKESIRKSPDVL